MLKPVKSPQWANKQILARRHAATWLAKRSMRRPDSKGKSLQKVDRFRLRFLGRMKGRLGRK